MGHGARRRCSRNWWGEKGNLGPGERHHISLRNDDRKTLVLVRNVKREQPRSAPMLPCYAPTGITLAPNMAGIAQNGRQKKRVTRSLQQEEVPAVIANPIGSPQKQGIPCTNARDSTPKSGHFSRGLSSKVFYFWCRNESQEPQKRVNQVKQRAVDRGKSGLVLPAHSLYSSWQADVALAPHGTPMGMNLYFWL